MAQKGRQVPFLERTGLKKEPFLSERVGLGLAEITKDEEIAS
jgi:hypothetical protein